MGVLRWLQRRVLWLLLGSYAAAALVPELGVRMHGLSAGTIRLHGATTEASLPAFMLALLLISAGLSTTFTNLRRLVVEPAVALAGLAVNVVWPLLFVLATAGALGGWRDGVAVECLVVGLAIAGAMPIAGASATWSNNADGDVTMSLGLVLASTLLSPLTTPLVLRAVAAVTYDEYSAALERLAQGGSVVFLVVAVIVPSLAGVGLRALLGAERVARALPFVKALSLVDLLALNYTNASLTLPRLVRSPDWGLIVLALVLSALLCAGGFALGWWTAKELRATREDRIALTFAVGMNNNGTGLVLAAAALETQPLVLLPILALTLVQQSGAGIADVVFRRRSTRLRQAEPGPSLASAS
jgi:BASS family bile acid:Na+ symporter